MSARNITPALPEGESAIARLSARVKKMGDKIETPMILRWGDEEVKLVVDRQLQGYVTDEGGLGRMRTYALQVDELSRMGNSVLSATLGVWTTPAAVADNANLKKEFDGDIMKVETIAASDAHRGTQIIELAKSLARWLKVKEVRLIDASYVKCPVGENYDLALFSLMRTGRTWYQAHGFMPLAGTAGATETAQRRLAAAAGNLRKITVEEVLEDCARAQEALDWVIMTNEYAAINFEQPHIWKRDKIIVKRSKNYSLDLVKTAHQMRAIYTNLLHTVRQAEIKGALARSLTDLQLKNCAQFAEIFNLLFDNPIYNWRQEFCVLNFVLAEGPHKGEYNLRTSLAARVLALLVGGIEKEDSWMYWRPGKD
jgi:hypothetical protein